MSPAKEIISLVMQRFPYMIKMIQQLLRIFISRLIILPWAMFVSQ
ncbi:MAG: hypothetical protein DYH00_04935 [Bacteroidetes bacterium CHB6]|nr:hypothetical protein [Bacteroidetes bacterium CHB6]